MWYSPIIYDRIYNHIMLKLIISITIFILNNQKALPKNNFSFMVLLNNNNNNIMKFLCWLNSTTFVMKNFKFNFFSIFFVIIWYKLGWSLKKFVHHAWLRILVEWTGDWWSHVKQFKKLLDRQFRHICAKHVRTNLLSKITDFSLTIYLWPIPCNLYYI